MERKQTCFPVATHSLFVCHLERSVWWNDTFSIRSARLRTIAPSEEDQVLLFVSTLRYSESCGWPFLEWSRGTLIHQGLLPRWGASPAFMNEGPTISRSTRSVTPGQAGQCARIIRHRICEFVYYTSRWAGRRTVKIEPRPASLSRPITPPTRRVN